MAQHNPREATAWRQKSKAAEEVTLPSGNVALIRRAGLQAFARQGRVPNSLLSLVQESQSKDIKAEDIMSDLGRLNDLMDFLDTTLVECVVEPKVKLPPQDEHGNVIPVEERNQEWIYTDEVDEQDKLFIFNFIVGGTRDLERFREQQAAAMGSVVDVEGAAPTPQ